MLERPARDDDLAVRTAGDGNGAIYVGGVE
jgi:hypothetical protein